MTEQVIAAFFNSRSDAETAISELTHAGIPRDAIRLMPENEADTPTTDIEPGARASTEERGFWASLADLFLPDEDRYTYAEAMRRGTVMVSVTVDEAHAARAQDILEKHGTVDIEQQEASWRGEGWRGYEHGAPETSGAAGLASGSAGMAGAGMAGAAMGTDPVGTGAMMNEGRVGSTPDRRDEGVGALAGSMSDDDASRAQVTTRGMSSDMGGRSEASGGMTMGDRAQAAGSDDVIPIVQEQLRVGKRQVQGGRVRVRSYVIETPVEEQVTLRQEHVEVERRPVDRAVGTGEDLFRERTIEANERTEEAVTSKEARVTEELVLRKNVEDRAQTVQDTVRRTEVEVDDDRHGSRDVETTADRRR